MALRARKVSGAFEEWAPGHLIRGGSVPLKIECCWTILFNTIVMSYFTCLLFRLQSEFRQ